MDLAVVPTNEEIFLVVVAGRRECRIQLNENFHVVVRLNVTTPISKCVYQAFVAVVIMTFIWTAT